MVIASFSVAMIQGVTAEPDRCLGADQHGVVKAVDLTALSEAVQTSWRDVAPDRLKLRDQFDRIANVIASGVNAGSSISVDDAIWFLEADPWCIYSGYAKAKIMRTLIAARLTVPQQDRLAGVVLAAIDVGWRWEFRESLKLARRLGGRRLRTGLRVRLHGSDLPVARRAAIALVRLRRPQLSDRDRRRAQDMVMSDLRNLVEQSRSPYGTWSLKAGRALMDNPWIVELQRQAAGTGLNREPARALLAEVGLDPDDDQTPTGR
jgi:hypothetical protein